MNNSVLDVMVRSVAIAAFLETPRDVEIILPSPQAGRPDKPSWLAQARAWLVAAFKGKEPSRTAGQRPGQHGRALPAVSSGYPRAEA